jgi:hypothetical protein
VALFRLIPRRRRLCRPQPTPCLEVLSTRSFTTLALLVRSLLQLYSRLGASLLAPQRQALRVSRCRYCISYLRNGLRPSHCPNRLLQLRATADALHALLESEEAKAPDATAARRFVLERLQEVQEHMVAAQASVGLAMLAAATADVVPQAVQLLRAAAEAAVVVSGAGSGLHSTMLDLLHRAGVR